MFERSCKFKEKTERIDFFFFFLARELLERRLGNSLGLNKTWHSAPRAPGETPVRSGCPGAPWPARRRGGGARSGHNQAWIGRRAAGRPRAARRAARVRPGECCLLERCGLWAAVGAAATAAGGRRGRGCHGLAPLLLRATGAEPALALPFTLAFSYYVYFIFLHLVHLVVIYLPWAVTHLPSHLC